MMAAESLTVNGSLHSSGEAYVTVERLHSEGDTPPIRVSGSAHRTGHSEVEVSESRAPNENLPSEAESARGFTSMVSGDLHHESSRIEIERLAIIPGKAEAIVGMYDGGYTVYDKVHLCGAVHDPGVVNVHIEDLYVF